MRRPAPDTPAGGRGLASERPRLGRLTRLDLPSRHDLPRDILAGITVGAAQIGNSMAYTMLSGIPPVHGLYAVMAGSPSGALTSSSERMSIVPTAALSLAAGSALALLPPEQRVPGMFMLAALTGAIMLLAGLLRAGGLVRFISNAVMVGFMAGISVTILCGQLAGLTGFSSLYDNKVAKAVDTVAHAGDLDPATSIIGVTTVVMVVILRRTRARLFAMAIALVTLTLAVVLFDLSSVAVVGDIAPIPRHLPLPQLPHLALAPSLLLPAVSLTIIGLVQGAGISRTVPNPDGKLGDASRDFVGQGVANLFSGFFTGGIVGGSIQATALDISAGARTRWSSVFAGAFVVAVILVAAPLVQLVPLAVTAGILMVAASSALRPRAMLDVWRADRTSAAVMLATFALVLVVPLQYAVLAGAAIAVLKHIYLSSLDVRVMQIVADQDGRLRETAAPAELTSDAVTVLDIYGSLFFAATPKIRASLPAAGGAHCAVVVLRLRGRGALHSATIALIRDYAVECASGGGRLYLAGVGDEMQEQLRRTGLLDLLGHDAVVAATDELYGACATAQQRGESWLADRAGGGAPGPHAV
jgi:sulfate permease, SulP family